MSGRGQWIGLPLAVAVFFVAAVTASAHGVSYSYLEPSSVVAFHARFSGGVPMAYSAVTVISPGGEEVQSGLTDNKGRFAFIPDEKGMWRVSVDGGMGHLLQFELEAGGEVHTQAAGEVPYWVHALLGISLTINLGFGVSMIRRKKRTP